MKAIKVLNCLLAAGGDAEVLPERGNPWPMYIILGVVLLGTIIVRYLYLKGKNMNLKNQKSDND